MNAPRFSGPQDYVSWYRFFHQEGPHPDMQYAVSGFQRFITMLVWVVSFCLPIIGALTSWLLLCLTGSAMPYARFHAWHALLFSLTSVACIGLFVLASVAIVGLPFLFGYVVFYVAVLIRGLLRIKKCRVTGYFTMLMTCPWVLQSHTAACREAREFQEAQEEQQQRSALLEQAAPGTRQVETNA